MSHYVCEGDCKTVAEIPGVCQSDICSKAGEELRICGCEDGSHSLENHKESNDQ